MLSDIELAQSMQEDAEKKVEEETQVKMEVLFKEHLVTNRTIHLNQNLLSIVYQSFETCRNCPIRLIPIMACSSVSLR